MVKALPSLATGRHSETLEILFAIVAGEVVFTGDIEYFLLAKALEDLVQCVKLGGFRKVSEIARVENQVGLVNRRVDLVDSELQGTVDVGIRRLVKADVAIADLNEVEVGGFGLIILCAK
jgi:hypothetical protein